MKFKARIALALLATTLFIFSAGSALAAVITLPDNTRAIGAEAFYANQKMTDCVLPHGVTEISSRAFAYSALERINLPSSVLSIAADAFTGCKSLIANVIEGSYAHAWCLDNGVVCNVTSATPASDFTYFTSYYNGANRVSITGYTGSATDIIIPASIDGNRVYEISSNAFKNHSGITSVDIPSTVERISYSAFEGCSSLKSVNLSSGLTSLNSSAFKSCTALTSISLPVGLTTLGGNCFQDCTALTSVSLPEGMTTLGAYCFDGCTYLASVSFPSTLISIGSDTFNGCTMLASINLPESLTTIGDWAFYECTNISSVIIPKNVTEIGDWAFYRCLNLASVTLPEGLLSIGSNAFFYCPLKSLTLPSSLKTLKGDAFGNTGLLSVTLPENITTCSACAFDDETRVYVDKNSITAHAMATKPNYQNYGFTDPQWPDYTIHYLVDEFTLEQTLVLNKYYGSAKSITIPAEITQIGRQAFYYNTYDYDTGKERPASPLETVRMHDGVTMIDTNAFYGHKNLKAVYLSANIDTWGNYVFSTDSSVQLYCAKDSTTAHSMTENAASMGFTDPATPQYSWLWVGDQLSLRAYRGTASSLTLPANVVSIGDYVFRDNKKLTAITLPAGMTSIGEGAFSGCINLKSIVLPNGITTIERDTFDRCTSLASVTFPSRLTTIGHRAFGYCSALTTLRFPDTLTSLGGNAFLSCTGLRTVYLPDTVTEWDIGPFEGCQYYNQTRFYCSTGSATAYGLSEHYQTFTDPASPTWSWRYNDEGELLVGGYHGSSTSITLPTKAVGVNRSAFYGNTTLVSIVVPSGMKTIGESAFNNCTKLTSLTLPASIVEIESGALYTSSDLVVKVVSGSYAHDYCKDHYINYVLY